MKPWIVLGSDESENQVFLDVIVAMSSEAATTEWEAVRGRYATMACVLDFAEWAAGIAKEAAMPIEALAEQWEDLRTELGFYSCRMCHQTVEGDGYDGCCPSCAGKVASC